MTGRKVNDLENVEVKFFLLWQKWSGYRLCVNQQALLRGCHIINKFGDEDLGAKMACMAWSMGIGNTDYSLC
jgi:hypothetical protein